ncbi:MAG: DUF21 domain-containing protein, partial [Chloroflexi bacterium]|nr:DUF21 domain-containing protein [Chloroflexota bacterium]
MSGIETVYLVIFIVCLLLSAFFSGAETAFTALQRIRVEHLVSTKVPGAARIARMMRHPEKLLSAILTGNNLVNTAAAVLATVLAVSLWGEQGILIATIGVTIILLVFCETTPKIIAAHNA